MISLVIPIYNEEVLIDELINRTLKALKSFGNDFEIIIVDDGSSDNSIIKLLKHRKQDDRIKIVQLSRNYGHQAAYTAGLTVAKGKFVAMMDGDLQDPPELIEVMYKKLISNENTDIIYAKRKSRKEKMLRRFLMKMFHKIFSKITRGSSIENVGNFSIFRDYVKDAILIYSEKNRYLPGIRFHAGFSQDYILFDRDERIAGSTKMSISKLISLALDALFSFSNLPLRTMLFIGFVGLFISLVGVIYVILSKLMGVAPFGWSSTLFFIFFFSSLQIMFLGLLGEYIYRIYKEVQNRPLFIIKHFHE
ncbi:MAG: glycosyltransferase family 2 protein [Bacteroidia bacterium]|nr:glycosyltransferase family 2 protein [Bacteroidia bacterium]MCZ2249928.1 glycosyltransferase family 2 protein [Bacteroidia bacterium]